MKSDCRQMIDVCKPRVYRDNVFYLTGLPVDASSRDITRRQDDLRAAEVSWDWQSEFRHVMPDNGIPYSLYIPFMECLTAQAAR